MNHQVWTRPLDENSLEEKKLAIGWLYEQRELNKFDPEVFKKKQLKIFVLFDRSGIVGFFYASPAILVDYIAFKPGSTNGGKVRVLQAVQQNLVSKAHERNVPNIFFRPSDEHFASLASNYGWKREEKMYRLSLADLERADEDHD